MPVNSTNLLQGAGTLYVGAFGAVEPTTIATAIDSAVWTDVGGTQEGLTLSVATEWSDLTVDQSVDAMGSNMTSRVVAMATSLAEVTLDNIARVLNEPVATAAVAGVRSFEPTDGTLAAFAPYISLLFEGRATSTGLKRRVILRRALSTEGLEMAAQKDAQSLLPVTWTGYGVSATVKPYKIIEATT